MDTRTILLVEIMNGQCCLDKISAGGVFDADVVEFGVSMFLHDQLASVGTLAFVGSRVGN